MAYIKTVWNPGAAPAINAANLNHLETQYDAVKAELQCTPGDIKIAAVNVVIQDAGGRFASGNLEGALAELFQMCR